MGTHPYIRLERKKEEEAAAAEPENGSDYNRIMIMLRTATGVDFSSYRQTTVKRRIARRMALKKADSIKRYLEVLRKEPDEVHQLYEDILITVTAFFRDPDVCKSLKGLVFPGILKDRPATLPLRIWVPGCSTGEEVYSIGISLFEALHAAGTNPPVQIFATDVSETAIEKARAGIYLESAVADVSPERLKRYFLKIEGGYQISKSIRDVCVFARQNITSDPPFSNLDLISCRNLLIYLEPVLQKRVVPIFHYALRPLGFLLLGSAETISGFGDLFVPVDRNHRIFAKRPGVSRPPIDFGRPSGAQVPEPSVAAHGGGQVSAMDLQKEADRLVVGRYGPAGVLVNDNYDVIQFRGRTSSYLEPPLGAATFNLLKMAREGLLVELRAALLKAKKTRRPTRAENLMVRQNGESHNVHVEVIPLREDGSSIHHYLVLFEEAHRKKTAEV